MEEEEEEEEENNNNNNNNNNNKKQQTTEDMTTKAVVSDNAVPHDAEEQVKQEEKYQHIQAVRGVCLLVACLTSQQRASVS